MSVSSYVKKLHMRPYMVTKRCVWNKTSLSIDLHQIPATPTKGSNGVSISVFVFSVSYLSYTLVAVSLFAYQCQVLKHQVLKKEITEKLKICLNLLLVNNKLLNFDQLLRLEVSKVSYRSKYTTDLLTERISYVFLSSEHQYRSNTRQRTSPNVRRFNHEIYHRSFVSRDVVCIKFFIS